MSLAKKINAAIAAHGCHMQQEESLIDHIVEHADEIRGSAVTAFNAAIDELNKAHAAAVALLEEKIQALTSELAAKGAAHADAELVVLATAEECEALLRAPLRTVDDSDAGTEHLADEAEPTEDEVTDDTAPVDADPKAVTTKLVKAPAKKPVKGKPAKKR